MFKRFPQTIQSVEKLITVSQNILNSKCSIFPENVKGFGLEVFL